MVRGSECRLLIVDDEEHITAALRDYFTLLGYVVDVAASEDAARALLGVADYAAVVTDLRLSDSRRMEGLGVVEYAHLRDPRTACVVLTAYGDPEQEREARRLGADALLRKPTLLPHLAMHIAELLETRATGIPRRK